MTVFATITFATFFLENDYFFSFNERKKNFTLNFSTFNGRCTDFNVAVGIDKENFVESDCVTLFHLIAEVVDIEVFTLFSFELLALDFYNCVHFICLNYQ